MEVISKKLSLTRLKMDFYQARFDTVNLLKSALIGTEFGLTLRRNRRSVIEVNTMREAGELVKRDEDEQRE